MDGQTSTAERFAAWSDLVSLVLVGTTIVTSGLTPTISIVPRSWKQIVQSSISITLLALFSAVRFIIEGIFVTTGPREFLVIGVIYLARWLWLLVSIRQSGPARRGLLVAHALLDLHTVRFGKSTFLSRRMANEIVVRKGKTEHGERLRRETRYWRGFVQSEHYYNSASVWVIELVEEGLHSRTLDKLGGFAYKQENNPIEIDDVYRTIYQLIMSVKLVEQQIPSFPVDFEPFFSEFGAVSSSAMIPLRTGSTGESPLADVARRVAADACYYIQSEDAESRTAHQVHMINECIRASVSMFVGENSDIEV